MVVVSVLHIIKKKQKPIFYIIRCQNNIISENLMRERDAQMEGDVGRGVTVDIISCEVPRELSDCIFTKTPENIKEKRIGASLSHRKQPMRVNIFRI